MSVRYSTDFPGSAKTVFVDREKEREIETYLGSAGLCKQIFSRFEVSLERSISE